MYVYACHAYGPRLSRSHVASQQALSPHHRTLSALPPHLTLAPHSPLHPGCTTVPQVTDICYKHWKSATLAQYVSNEAAVDRESGRKQQAHAAAHAAAPHTPTCTPMHTALEGVRRWAPVALVLLHATLVSRPRPPSGRALARGLWAPARPPPPQPSTRSSICNSADVFSRLGLDCHDCLPIPLHTHLRPPTPPLSTTAHCSANQLHRPLSHPCTRAPSPRVSPLQSWPSTMTCSSWPRATSCSSSTPSSCCGATGRWAAAGAGAGAAGG